MRSTPKEISSKPKMTKGKAIAVFAIIGVLIVMGAVFAFVSLDNGELGVWDYKAFPRAISLGLDMKGGVYAVFEANTDNTTDLSSRMDGTAEQLSKMLYNKGYTEATVAKVGDDRLRVEVPDVSDPKTLFNLIGTPSSLEFRTEGQGEELTDAGLWVDGKHLEKAYVSLNNNNEYVVAIKFDSYGTERFAAATTELSTNNGVLNIWVNGEWLMGPSVKNPITDGSAIIESADWASDYTAASDMATKLLAGAFDVELKLVESREISATLGDNALSTSLLIGAIAIAIIIILLILLYRLLGVASGIALIYYVITYVFILSVFPWVQLTLAGIAGVILSIGMAVDGNIVVFSRVRDEFAMGNAVTYDEAGIPSIKHMSVHAAIKAGFAKGTPAIVDGNITTLLGCIVMLFVGGSAIKSFAITLMIGIIFSMLTVLLVSRLICYCLYALVGDKPKVFNLPVTQVSEGGADNE